ncbi:hypothetical protein GCM10010129_74740 [Streptomyces fumigatiscleroticus]|nr:hypothetical protein GCM10010129_74740 [Streptomyces fumigatiscleroticus]
MAGSTQDDEAYGRSGDPAEDAAEHLAAAIGTEAWPRARDGLAGLLPGDDGPESERVQAWAAEALRLEGEDRDHCLEQRLPEWRRHIEEALAADPHGAEQARAYADTVRSLLPPPGTGTAQVTLATGESTVNTVQNGNLYYQVVLGLAPRRRKLGRRAVAGTVAVTGAASVVAGNAAADGIAADAVRSAGDGHLPQGPLAGPAPAPAPAAPPTAAPAPAGGAAATAQGGTGLVAKAGSALVKAVTLGGAGAGGVSVPVLVTVASVVAVVVTTVSIVVPLAADRGSCDAAAEGRPARAVLAEAARRVELTSFRFAVTRGRQRVTGAADPQSRMAWFRQGVTGGRVTTGTIDRGKVVLPAGTATPPGADSRWVRADGAFVDAVDPAAPARQLRSVTAARRDGCTFTGTLVPSAAAAETGRGTVEPVVARAATAPPSSPSAGSAAVRFSARIDDRGRLIRLGTEAPPDGLPVSARYWAFGLTVAPTAPPTAAPSGTSPSAAPASALDGEWAGGWSASGYASGGFTATLTLGGDRITGTLTVGGTPCSLDGPLSGTLEGDRITFGTVNSADRITFTGSVDGATMSGTFETDCSGAAGSWTARRTGA